MKIVVLDGYTTNPGDLSFDSFKKYGELYLYGRTDDNDILSRALGAEIIITNKTRLNAKMLDMLPSCKYIGLLSTGYDAVDVKHAAEKGIIVTNIPSYSTNAVAQMTFALILSIYNHAEMHSETVKSGKWCDCNDFCYYDSPLYELQGKTIGLFGFGRIAKAVAKIALAFGMNVIAYSRSDFSYDGVTSVSLDQLFSNSDILSLHAPLNEDSFEIIRKENIDKMKKGSIIINTARGKLINEKDLADALNSGKIYAAGVDVLSTEPPKKENPLLSCKNCIITPHIAWAARETRQRLLDIALKNLESFLNGFPMNIVK